MAYEWDAAKAHLNAAKHNVRFNDTVSALEDDRALTQRDFLSEDEERWITIGQDSLDRVVIVVYTWRGNDIRIISARLATRRERRQYLENL